jgi:arylsulfatase
MGWNALREQIFANQKKAGVIPANAKLTPWPDSLAKWDTLSADEKKLFARQAEVYAAYTAYTDHEIGRVIQAVQDLGKLDNTLIIYIDGDNGTSPEGTLLGTPNQYTSYNGVLDFPVAEQLKFYDAWGSMATYPHMAVAWSWAFDTPFQYTKQIASHFGGTRQGLAISWPAGIKDVGGVRTQFHHVIDIVPTILEATGVKAPELVNGIKQEPIEGVSMAYTFDKANAKAPSTRKTQYFEMVANRGIYHERLYACHDPARCAVAARHCKLPGRRPKATSGSSYNQPRTTRRPTTCAAKMPGQAASEMQELFLWRRQVQRLPPRQSVMLRAGRRRGRTRTRATDVFTTYSRIACTRLAPANVAEHPRSPTRSPAVVESLQGGGDGMIVTPGGRCRRRRLYVLKGKPVSTYNLLISSSFRWKAAALSPRQAHDRASTSPTTARASAKGAPRPWLKMEQGSRHARRSRTRCPFSWPSDETFDVGVDTRTPVNDKRLPGAVRFTGKLDQRPYNLNAEQLFTQDAEKVRAAALKRD